MLSNNPPKEKRWQLYILPQYNTIPHMERYGFNGSRSYTDSIALVEFG